MSIVVVKWWDGRTGVLGGRTARRGERSRQQAISPRPAACEYALYDGLAAQPFDAGLTALFRFRRTSSSTMSFLYRRGDGVLPAGVLLDPTLPLALPGLNRSRGSA